MENDNNPFVESLKTVRLVAECARIATKEIAIEAIENGGWTRKAVADVLTVHPLTISRWLTAATVEAPEESERNYPPAT